MTDQTAGSGTGQTGTDPIITLRAKLEEIRAEKGLSPDALEVLYGLVDQVDANRTGLIVANDSAATEAGNVAGISDHVEALQNALDGMRSDVGSNLTGVLNRLAELEARPAQHVTAQGIDLAPLADVQQRIASARENGSLPGNVAAILEGVVACFGVREAPPAPPPEVSEPEPPAAPVEGATDGGASPPASDTPTSTVEGATGDTSAASPTP